MDAVLEDLLSMGCLVHLDDIITCGHSFEQRLERLASMLERLEWGCGCNPVSASCSTRKLSSWAMWWWGREIDTNPEKILVV